MAKTAERTIDLSKIQQINDHVWHAQSADFETNGVVYVVARNLNTGKLTCNCDGGILGGKCWHLTGVVRFVAMHLPPFTDAPEADPEVTERRAALRSLISGGKR